MRSIGGLTVGLVLGQGPGLRPAHAATEPLPARPRSLAPLLARATSRAEPVVALFTRPGCPWCEALRREQIGPLAREAGARGLQVVEFDVTDSRAFEPPASGTTASASASGASASGASASGAWATARSPADLAARLKVGVTPTVIFLGGAGEIADRLVGYPSRDFYAAYLEERIERASATLSAGRR
jgi:thioredoxin-related protein